MGLQMSMAVLSKIAEKKRKESDRFSVQDVLNVQNIWFQEVFYNQIKDGILKKYTAIKKVLFMNGKLHQDHHFQEKNLLYSKEFAW